MAAPLLSYFRPVKRPDPVGAFVRRQEDVRHDTANQMFLYGDETDQLAIEILKLRRDFHDRPDDHAGHSVHP